MNDTQQLRDAFANPQSRLWRTVVAIDVVGSTTMKEQQPQAAWLNSFGWLYDTVRDIATAAVPDAVIKYLGDGIMCVVDTDHTTEAVNAVIQIQEIIDKASKGSGGTKGVIDFSCSVGVSTGEVVGFVTPGGAPDFIGTVVDKAFRLCAAASARAVFADTATIGTANLPRITSVIGTAMDRNSDQYQGNVQRTVLKGFEQPVAYHEILWNQQLHGLKSEIGTDSADRLQSVPKSGIVRELPRRSEPTPTPTSNSTTERHRGQITFWNQERDFGFAHDPDTGEDFHVCGKVLVYQEDVRKLAHGREIVFVASGAPNGAKKREAGAVMVVGEPADGPLIALPKPPKTNGWIRVEDAVGTRHLVYVPPKEVAGHRVGDILGFTVAANDKGASARHVEPVDDAEEEERDAA